MPQKQALTAHRYTGKLSSSRSKTSEGACSAAASKLALRQVTSDDQKTLARCRQASHHFKRADRLHAAGKHEEAHQAIHAGHAANRAAREQITAIRQALPKPKVTAQGGTEHPTAAAFREQIAREQKTHDLMPEGAAKRMSKGYIEDLKAKLGKAQPAPEAAKAEAAPDASPAAPTPTPAESLRDRVAAHRASKGIPADKRDLAAAVMRANYRGRLPTHADDRDRDYFDTERTIKANAKVRAAEEKGDDIGGVIGHARQRSEEAVARVKAKRETPTLQLGAHGGKVAVKQFDKGGRPQGVKVEPIVEPKRQQWNHVDHLMKSKTWNKDDLSQLESHAKLIDKADPEKAAEIRHAVKEYKRIAATSGFPTPAAPKVKGGKKPGGKPASVKVQPAPTVAPTPAAPTAAPIDHAKVRALQDDYRRHYASPTAAGVADFHRRAKETLNGWEAEHLAKGTVGPRASHGLDRDGRIDAIHGSLASRLTPGQVQHHEAKKAEAVRSSRELMDRLRAAGDAKTKKLAEGWMDEPAKAATAPPPTRTPAYRPASEVDDEGKQFARDKAESSVKFHQKLREARERATIDAASDRSKIGTVDREALKEERARLGLDPTKARAARSGLAEVRHEAASHGFDPNGLAAHGLREARGQARPKAAPSIPSLSAVPELYHGSPSPLASLQAGSMMTNDPSWAAGYSTRTDPATSQERFTGKVHSARPNIRNPYNINGGLHDAENHLIRLAAEHGYTGGTLNGAAKHVNAKLGHDAIVAHRDGKIVGAIPLVDTPVAKHHDPVDILRKSPGASIPDNLKRALASHAAGSGPTRPPEAVEPPGVDFDKAHDIRRQMREAFSSPGATSAPAAGSSTTAAPTAAHNLTPSHEEFASPRFGSPAAVRAAHDVRSRHLPALAREIGRLRAAHAESPTDPAVRGQLASRLADKHVVSLEGNEPRFWSGRKDAGLIGLENVRPVSHAISKAEHMKALGASDAEIPPIPKHESGQKRSGPSALKERIAGEMKRMAAGTIPSATAKDRLHNARGPLRRLLVA